MLVLGIETSCDETAAAVVRGGRTVLSNVVWSQVRVHAPYGGVVPELASRAHVRNIATVVDLALRRAGLGLEAIDAVAATRGPGLVGSLLVGLEFAKSLAFARRLPLIAVHHIAAHLYSPFLSPRAEAHEVMAIDAAGGPLEIHEPSGDGDATTRDRYRAPRPRYPYLGLAVSGGHSSLARVEAPGRCRTLGETRDDAVGEAYDKVAKLLGLDYPGGPVLDRLAREGDPTAIRFPRPLSKQKTLDFSFSGLKTAVLLHVEKVGLESIREDRKRLCDLAASFQAAVIDSLLAKTRVALERERLDSLAVVGGVACNSGLRKALRAMKRRAARAGGAEAEDVLGPKRLWIPPTVLCTDNAAMIAGLAHHLASGSGPRHNDLTLNADPGWPLEDKAAGAS